jgi:hypothetical protein
MTRREEGQEAIPNPEATMTLPGKSRTITVEPVEVPDRAPAERPEEAPVRERETDAPAKEPSKKPEKVPG